MHLCDDIIVIEKGKIIEHGSFRHLMSKKGRMAKLVNENVQILRENPELQELESNDGVSSIVKHNTPHLSHLPSISENLTEEQTQNRAHLSRLNSIDTSDNNMARLIEKNQMIGHAPSQTSLIREIQKARLSIVSAANSIEEITPSDAEPMKLVLEDQSVNYKVSPFFSYLKSGWGVVITLSIFAFFFLVHLVRILSDYW